MAVYAVVNIRVTDPDRYAKYREQAPATITRYGGKLRTGEVPRTLLTRRSMNKGKRKGRSCYAPALLKNLSYRALLY